MNVNYIEIKDRGLFESTFLHLSGGMEVTTNFCGPRF
jgi:hypothetical protein